MKKPDSKAQFLRASCYLMRTGLRVVAGAAKAELDVKNILRIAFAENGEETAQVTMRDGEMRSVELEPGYHKLCGTSRDGRVFFTFLQKVKDIEFARRDP